MIQQLPLQFEFRANRTFNDFFSGGNQETITHLKNSISGEGEKLVFIWGSTGLGKSHLLQACCHQAQALGKSSFYFTFPAAELPSPGLLQGLEQFELVCLDDIENLIGNPEWELALFNFFNQHRDLNHTLILSADNPPNELGIKLNDLKTRLNWGLVLKLQSLSDGDKIAALRFKARLLGFEIPPQVGQFLLAHYDRDLASLWILLEKLDSASLAAKRKLTVPFLKQVLGKLEGTERG